uniref:ATP synthase subunit a n=1 Tax=Ophioplinthus gelida TaxID=696348 RepID=A0A3G2WHK2_9ECHI|nr:ATP synthase F0 subunit 6 [Ophioplinthus gelida]AYO99588.1 ATP synthase F0 subunit 6 [Ophioplinthus gelida]
MNMTINNIFNQFLPAKISIFSLSLIGSLIALAWLWFNSKTHYTISQNNSPIIFLMLLFNLLLKNINIKICPWNPCLFSLFIIILSYNLLGLIPYTFSQTSHLSFTLSLSIPLWISIQVVGFKTDWKHKISSLLPQGTPTYLIPIMIIIETISILIQPITLGFRLGANLLAGHLLIFLCSCTIWEAISITPSFGFLSLTLIIILIILELAVAFIQSIVFLILSKSYLEENLNI